MRHKRTRNIVIELTSLLDIVMILVFAVMIKNSQLVEESKQEVSELQKENATMQEDIVKYEGIAEELANALGKLEDGDLETLLEQLHDAENKLNTYEYMNDIVVVYNVGLENRYNNTSRCLSYGRASDEYRETYNVKRNATDEWDYAINSLKLDLKEYVDEELQENAEEKYIYLVFSVDRSKVYSNDYDDVEKVLTACETKYGDARVRYRLNILEEDNL